MYYTHIHVHVDHPCGAPLGLLPALDGHLDIFWKFKHLIFIFLLFYVGKELTCEPGEGLPGLGDLGPAGERLAPPSLPSSGREMVGMGEAASGDLGDPIPLTDEDEAGPTPSDMGRLSAASASSTLDEDGPEDDWASSSRNC